jgi:hypothetical protein
MRCEVRLDRRSTQSVYRVFAEVIGEDGDYLPPHEVRVGKYPDASEQLESLHDGRVTDALVRLPRLPKE